MTQVLDDSTEKLV
jgi:pSer/pThr/pTyr-binding forkhead associated (FHA) protein